MKFHLILIAAATGATSCLAQNTGRLPVNEMKVVDPDPSAPMRVTQDPLPQTDEGLPRGVITRTKVVNRTNYVPVATYPTPTPSAAPSVPESTPETPAVATTVVEPLVTPTPAPVPAQVEEPQLPPPAKPKFLTQDVRPRGEAATGWNAGIYAGANLSQNAQVRTSLFNALSSDYKAKEQTNFAIGGKIGYTYPFESFSFNKRLPGIKLTTGIEADLSYLQSDLKGSLTDGPSDALTGVSGSPLLSTYTPLKAKLNIDSGVFMLNWLGKMQVGDSFRPYIGAGVGVTYTTMSSSDLSNIGNNLGTKALGGLTFPNRKASNLGLAYQVLAGGEFFLQRDWSLFGEYKYVVFDSFTTLQFPIETKIGSLGNHVVVFGVKTYF